MNDDKKTKKDARAAAHKLRKQAGWSTHDFKAKDPIEKLRELESEEKARAAVEASVDCPDCAAMRAETGDDTALCQEHLAAAMGF